MKKIFSKKDKKEVFASNQKDDFRSILLIGITGAGKSSLANALVNKNGNFEEIFKESSEFASQTKKVQVEKFESEGINYQIIDTAGIGDTQLPKEKILIGLEEISSVIGDGINQVLFIINGRFSEEEILTYKLLKEAIFDEDVGKYTTVVRVNFAEFEYQKACEKCTEDLKKESQELAGIINSVKIVYLDNPPMKGRYKDMARDSREESRKRLLKHLKENCQKTYSVRFLGKFYEAVDEFNLIVRGTNHTINEIDYWFFSILEQFKTFISERREIIEIINKRKEELKEHMKNRYIANTAGHVVILSGKALAISGIWFPPALIPGTILSASGWLGVAGSEINSIIKEKGLYDSFEDKLNKDRESLEKLKLSQKKLEKFIKTLEEIHLQFKNSEYRKLDMNKEKIEVIDRVMNWVLANEKEVEKTGDYGEQKEGIEHSTNWMTKRAVLEAIAKIVPSPLSFYCIYRDGKEMKARTSLEDMEKIVEEWKDNLKEWSSKALEYCELYQTFKMEIDLDKLINLSRNWETSNHYGEIQSYQSQIQIPPKQ